MELNSKITYVDRTVHPDGTALTLVFYNGNRVDQLTTADLPEEVKAFCKAAKTYTRKTKDYTPDIRETWSDAEEE